MAKKSVTEKLGLKRLKKATPASCRARANKIQSLLDKKKVAPSLVKSAERMVAFYHRKASASKKKSIADKSTKVAKTLKVSKGKASKKFDKNQGFIPGFLAQMNMVRVEELIADKVFNAIKTGDMKISLQKKAI